MPILKIQTSKEIADPEVFMQDATQLLSELLQKPVKYIMIIHDQKDMMFGGETSPAAWCELKSIGLPEHRTTELSAAISAFLEDRLKIPKDRVYIEFTNSERHLWGWNGGTF